MDDFLGDGLTEQPARHRQSLEERVAQYVAGCLAVEQPPVPTLVRILWGNKINYDNAWLSYAYHRNWDEGMELEILLRGFPQRYIRALETAARTSDTHKSGLTMGFLAPSLDIDFTKLPASEEFCSGVRDGQIYRLKASGGKRIRELKQTGQRGIMLSAALIYLDSFSLGSSLSKTDAENMVMAAPYVTGAALAAAGCLVYGTGTMLATRLFCNDMNISRKLITAGPFRLHRNPYYAAMGAGALFGGAAATAVGLMGGDPFGVVGAALAIPSLCVFLYSHHLSAKADERVLEKTFGDEYRQYKERTPRYFPNPLALPAAVVDVVSGAVSVIKNRLLGRASSDGR